MYIKNARPGFWVCTSKGSASRGSNQRVAAYWCFLLIQSIRRQPDLLGSDCGCFTVYTTFYIALLGCQQQQTALSLYAITRTGPLANNPTPESIFLGLFFFPGVRFCRCLLGFILYLNSL